MSKVIKLKKGLDIKLNGQAEEVKTTAAKSKLYAVRPTNFRNLSPKLAVRLEDVVKAGDALFFDKQHPEIAFTSPVSGKIEAIVRGERRKLLEVVINADPEIQYKDFGKADVNNLSREKIISTMLESGVWPMIIQRPYAMVADPQITPKAIFVSAFDSAPLAPNYDFALKGQEKDLQTGIDCLNKLCKNVYFNTKAGSNSFTNIKNVIVTEFAGPHPAGNVGIQIHHLNPINKGEYVWTVNIQDLVIIGRLFNTGKYDARKTIAVAGSEIKKPAYVEIINGASIDSILNGNTKGEQHERIISGNVLTGEKVEKTSYLGFYSNMVTVIPEGDEYEFLGWAMPGFNKFSASKLFPSFLCPNKRYSLNANFHGEGRAFVVSGQYEKVLPMDIYPVYLLKAILAGDIDRMEQLGIYEIAAEDFALCEFVCTSKTPVQKIINDGIDLMIKETN